MYPNELILKLQQSINMFRDDDDDDDDEHW